MKTTLYDGSRKIPVDTRHDDCLYAAARPKAREAGVEVTGKDLYLHFSTDRQATYYLHLWSANRDLQEKIIPISPIMADRFLRGRGLICSLFPKNSPAETLYNYGYGLIEEF